MTRIRRLALLTVFGFLVSLLSACGSGGGDGSSINLPGYSRYLARSGNTIYVGDPTPGNNRVHVVDVTDPRSPRRVSSFDSPSLSGAMVASGNILYVGAFYTVRVMDVSNPAAPVQIATIPTHGGAFKSVLAENRLYVSHQMEGMVIVDVADPANPVVLGTLPDRATAIAVKGNTAYVGSNDSILLSVDVSDPAQPVIVDSTEVGGAFDMDISGDLLFVALGSDGMRVLDISNPEAPQLRGSMPLQTGRYVSALSVAAGRPGRVYLGASFGGLLAVDVSNPEQPVTLAAETSGEALSILIDGNTLYAARGDAGLDIFDITTP